MGWSAVGAVVAAGISYAGAQGARRDNWKQWEFNQTQNAAAAYAEADATIGSANAQAGAIMGQANAEANAFVKQADVERGTLYQQAAAARDVAYQNIGKMKMEADETLRRLEGEQVVWEEKAKAKAAASGVRQDEGTSTELVITGIEQENDRQYGWLKKSYDTGLDVAKNTAEAEAGVTRRQGDAAVEAGQIRANAALEAGRAVAGATVESGRYYASSLRKKGDSYLAPVKQRTEAKAKVRSDWAAQQAVRAEYGGK